MSMNVFSIRSPIFRITENMLLSSRHRQMLFALQLELPEDIFNGLSERKTLKLREGGFV